MVGCLIFISHHYPFAIIKTIINSHFKVEIIDYVEEEYRLSIFIYNVNLDSISKLIEQFKEANTQIIIKYGIGHSKQEAKKRAVLI